MTTSDDAETPASPAWLLALWAAFQSLLALMLFMVLVVQVLIAERDHIAAMEPSIKPWLQTLCQPFHCKVDHWKRVDLIQVNDSSFNKVKGSVYELSATLVNQAGAPVAAPALELTLTDAQNQAVVRHVFLAQELEAPTLIRAGGEWPIQHSVLLDDNLNDRVMGYSLVAFYP